MDETAALWGAVVVSGLYHGLNPGMGWPLAVSAGLMERERRALFTALVMLALGHLVAMLAILLPFAALSLLVEWQREIRLGAGALVVVLGLWLLIERRHPRFLARIPPSQLALWSFLIAIVHGAGLMLVPIYLGLCGEVDLDAGHRAAAALATGNLALAGGVAVFHTLAMLAAGGAAAWAVYRWTGLGALRRGWLDLHVVWAGSLILVGALGIYAAY